LGQVALDPPRRVDGRARGRGGDVVCGLFFFPRSGSAQVARALGRTLGQAGWEVTLAAGSLGGVGEQTNASTFFAGLDVVAVDYSSERGDVPFQPSCEDRPGAPDRVFTTLNDGSYERLVEAWADAQTERGLLRQDRLPDGRRADRCQVRAMPRCGSTCRACV
jgi:hypothetical protein